jgi:hypothetical protein
MRIIIYYIVCDRLKKLLFKRLSVLSRHNANFTTAKIKGYQFTNILLQFVNTCSIHSQSATLLTGKIAKIIFAVLTLCLF